MNTIMQYIFEANATLLIFGVCYFAFFRNETDFRSRRFYILGTTLVSLFIPLLHLDFLFGSNKGAVQNLQTIILPEIIIGHQAEIQTLQTGSGWLDVLAVIYLCGAVVLMGWFLFQLGQVLWLFLSKRTEIIRQRGHALILTHGALPTFSFFRLLFLDNSVGLSEEERSKIIAHETTHIRQWHSLDIILLELVKIVFWLNPVCWYFRNDIQDIHEYLADEQIVRQSDPEDYRRLLAKMALNKAHLSIGHHFNKSKTLKRITMMNRTKTTVRSWKWLVMVPIVGLVVLAFSCNDEVMNDMNDVMEGSTMTTDYPPEVRDQIAQLQKEHPDLEFGYMETYMDNKEKVEELKKMDPNTIAQMNVDKDKTRIGIIYVKNGVMDQVSEATKKDGDVFLVVEDPAEPVGGYPAFYQYIANNLKYPEQARKMGVEGKVFVQFVLDEQGNITEVKTVKGIGAGCDAEAIRVISESPQWKPAMQRGKKVKQRIIIPIVFDLGDDQKLGMDKPIPADSEMNVEYSRSGKDVSGTVTDPDGKPMAGVNIVVANTTRGTVSDIDGSFTIKGVAADENLVLSYVGFKSVRLTFD